MEFFCPYRVLLNVEKPLKRRMRIKREGDGWSWLNFKYERLGTFCFVCGILGHSERECSIVYANPDKQVRKLMGHGCELYLEIQKSILVQGGFVE